MTRDKFFIVARDLWEKGEISTKTYDDIWRNADAFCDEEDDTIYQPPVVTKEQLENAIAVLTEAKEDFESLISVFKGIVYNPDYTDQEVVNLVDLNQCIASTIWTQQDIRDKLTEYGIPVSQENVTRILQCIDKSSMEDCSDGWEVIYDAIRDCFCDDEEEDYF